jgi:4-diphosphocytidyl-2-C-methyl-D-erythritol kinase
MLFLNANGALVVHAPAKLNLFLEILGKRSDGYHELETLMVTVGWYDTLSVTGLRPETPLSGTHLKEDSFGPIRLTCREAGSPVRPGHAAQQGSPAHHGQEAVPAGDDNLVVRAARLLQEATGCRDGVEIDLVKRIPMAAGLAGGSSDAAAALWACNRVWQLGLSREELTELASRLGSDVAFFLSGRPAAVCRGRGERVEPVDLPAGLNFVIAKPDGGLSTPLVYRHCRPSPSPASVEPLLRSLQSGRLQDAGALLHNALQEPAEHLSSEVSRLRSLFSQQPVSGHLMSGSGTAYFALCAHSRQAQQVAARVRAAGVRHVAVVQSRS